MTEHTHPDGRSRDSFAAAAVALARLGRLRDLPVILMLAWVGWLAIPWPLSGVAQARSAASQPLNGTASAGLALDTDTSISQGTAGSVGWALTGAPGDSVLLVKPEPRPTTPETRPATVVEPATVADQAHVSVSARELIDAERARIVGEVHDAAGHSLATIAMQAGVALLMLDERPDQVRESLEAIRSTSTEALNQLRSALDLIDPKVSDHDLPRLIDGVRAAGLSVDVEPPAPNVPAHLQGTVYRVVRESLTNVMRHAGPTKAVVRVASDPCEFVLEVADRGSGLFKPAEGRGLAGMRARVTEAGGTFSAGPREGGGFHVVARFPVDTA